MFELRGAPVLDAVSFARIARIAYAVAGINLNAGKEKLVQMRLVPRLRATGADAFSDYLDAVERGTSDEMGALIEALTTNKTSFFREGHHFHFLQQWLAGRGPVRGWSAGCSSGEEAYTLAMIIAEQGRARVDSRILATDINARVLQQGRDGVYDAEQVSALPASLRDSYMQRIDGGRYEVSPLLRQLVRFARLNLMGRWPMHGPFDFIFCRNVMIYFDRETRQRLCSRLREMLTDDGLLFLGHSESLMGGGNGFAYVQPAVYRKAPDDCG